MRKLSWMIAAVLSTLPAWAGAVELGQARVDSHLTEHLKVVIPLSGLGSTPIDEVKVRLAPQKFYDQAGLSLDSLSGNITFEIKELGSKPVVIVHSKRIITDPILSMLLEVSSGDSQVIKEYDLLLNPPVGGREESAAASSASLKGSRSSGAGNWQTVQNVPDVSMGGTYKVQRGDTLYDIARRAVNGGKIPVRGMMQAIINANPEAFVDGNGNALRSGVTLKVPTAAAANTPSPEAPAAAATPAENGAAALPTTKLAAIDTPAVAATQPQPKLELLSAEPKAGAAASAASPLAESASASAGAAAGAPSVTGTASAVAGTTQQTDEAIASIDAKSAAMSKQIELLNDQLKQVQGLVAERNQNIAQLQQKVKQSEEQTQQIRQRLESNANNFWVQWGPYLLGGAGLLIILLLLVAVSRRRRDAESEPYVPTGYASSSAPHMEPKAAVIPVATASSAAAVMAEEVAAPIVPSAPPFNPASVIEEVRLLVSYHLDGQAVSTLQEAIHQHPEELALYQELARLHSENHDSHALNQTLATIEEKFGADQVPHLPAADEVSALHGAVNIFDASYDAPVADPVNESDAAQAPVDFLDDIPASAFGGNETPAPLAFELPETNEHASPVSLDFDLDSVAPVESAPSAVHESGLTLDLPASEPLGASGGVHPMGEVEEPSSAVIDPALDTRLGLVEAFLSVGDHESYQMIADEIESEGNAALIDRLREIKQRFGKS
ncbi:FimV family protein [Halothiobacillus sp. DCM-1]|uniref:type IV pilus assembly protein FimV n=1 Tax=Halothiobacillus sp. DCM-1 TaxID=3112558 RepID=UPI00324CBA05